MKILATLLFGLFAAAGLPAQTGGLTGYWREPGGATIGIAPCGAELCATLVQLSKTEPYTVDGNNTDPKLRNRALCGLEIGKGFHPKGPDRAEGGKLYDPKSGRTYSGSMTVKGDKLDLRGYIGLSVFGRSETWTRVPEKPAACKA